MIQALGGVEGILEHTLFKGFVKINLSFIHSLFYFIYDYVT